jgi:hypothetical protein
LQPGVESLISLVAYGNHFLQTGDDCRLFLGTHTCFGYIQTINFRERDKRKWYRLLPPEKTICSEAADWFSYLKINGYTRIQLHYDMAGDCDWMIRTSNGKRSVYWQCDWVPVIPVSGSRKRFAINCVRIAGQVKPLKGNMDVTFCRQQLEHVLQALVQLYGSHQLNCPADTFRYALNLLHAAKPEALHYAHDLLTGEIYPLPSKQLIYAAVAACLPTGKGVWSDMGFSNQAEDRKHTGLLDDLHTAIALSIPAAVNTLPVVT